MPEHLRAFVVVIVVTISVFALIRKPAIEVIGAETFSRWRAAWVSLTMATFLITDFWIFLAVATLIVVAVAVREPARPALYLLLLLAAPPISHSIPGFAGINRFFDVGLPELLAILLLVPVLMNRARMTRQSEAMRMPDLLFWLFFALTVVLTLRATTLTDTMRTAFAMFLGMVLPYLVFSRWPRSLGDLRLLAAAFVLPLFVLAVIGVFGMLKGWHLYAAVASNWGNPLTYLTRVNFLRAYASVSGPIQFGYVLMVGGGLLLLAMGSDRPAARSRGTALAWLGAGLVSSLSRGPWVGAAILMLAFLATGRGAFQNVVKLGLAGLVALMIALASPAGDLIIGLIPFVGDIEVGTISYRQRLFENSWIVIQRNPLLGSVDYLETPEMQAMIQGQGIIDIVNTYLRVALNTGFIGLSLFCGFFLSVLVGLRRAVKALPEEETDLRYAGRALIATLIAILVTIATVSSVGPIPIMYWTVAGLCVAQTRIIHQRIHEIDAQASRRSRDESSPARQRPPVTTSPARVPPDTALQRPAPSGGRSGK